MTTLVDIRTGGHHQENLQEEDFWAEAAHNRAHVTRIEDEEQRGNVTDEGEAEAEADWLEACGLGEWSVAWRQGKSLPENDINGAVQKLSLTVHQADAVRRRVRTLNATLKRKKTRRPPDVRSFFQNEISENKDSSRSATPDSLDSNDFLSSDSPPRRNSSPNIDNPNSHSADEIDDQMPNQQVPQFVSIFAHDHPQFQASASPPSKNKDIFRPRFQVRGSSNALGEIATDTISGIEMLNYHNVGTIYMKGYIPNRMRNTTTTQVSHMSPMSLPNPTLNAPDISSRNHSAFAKSGFTEELNRRNNGNAVTTDVDDDDLISEDLYIDPCGLTRLCDLSPSDVKKIRSVLIMELTAQCDLLNIQFRRKKPSKSLKKNSVPGEDGTSQLFGVNLEWLLAKDRQVTGDEQLEVPIIFDKLCSHIWKRSICEEGILRLGGGSRKINDLRSVFETSLYTEPEQVDAAMNQYSSHDVANLLKQFLRELQTPLLGDEYVDTFFDVASQMKDRSQENCLRLLILLLPLSHQAVLRMFLQLLRDVCANSETNKMNLVNVALIVAPNLVPASALGDKNQELSKAATWVKLTQMLIKLGPSLFWIPSDLVSQLRQINEREKEKGNNNKKGKAKPGNGKVSGRSVATSAPMSNCSPCNNLIVSAPQLGFPSVTLELSAGTTAGDVVLSLLEEAERKAEDLEREATQSNNLNARRRPRANQEISKNGPNLSCLLTQVNRDSALKSHNLYEMGGNIGFRRIESRALVAAICRDNPSAQWTLKCNHRHSKNV